MKARDAIFQPLNSTEPIKRAGGQISSIQFQLEVLPLQLLPGAQLESLLAIFPIQEAPDELGKCVTEALRVGTTESLEVSVESQRVASYNGCAGALGLVTQELQTLGASGLGPHRLTCPQVNARTGESTPYLLTPHPYSSRSL